MQIERRPLARVQNFDHAPVKFATSAINIDALLALGASLSTQASFLLLARIFEDIGVTPYAGAAGFLVGSPYLGTAPRILAVEGEHVGNIR